MNYKKTITLLSLSIILVIIATAGVTYAYLSFSGKQATPNVLNSACFNLTSTDASYINYTGYPTTEANAKNKYTPYEITLTNSCETAIDTNYQVVLNVLNTTSSSLLTKLGYIYFSIDDSAGAPINKTPVSMPTSLVPKENTVSGSYLLTEGTLTNSNKSATHKLYIWFDKDLCDGNACQDIMGSTFNAQVSIYSKAS